VSDVSELNQLLPEAPVLAKSLAKLARGDPGTLESYLETVEVGVAVEGTMTRAHCYFLAVDGNGQVRTDDFIERICEHLVDFAIPRTKIREASDYLANTGSSQKWIRLANEARTLFTDLAITGEGGELILFVLAEHVFGLPQIICKMSLKTSGQVHYHGCDGVHAGIDKDGMLSLYWGESKMYADPAAAISNCVASLAVYLKGDAVQNKRDVQLLRSYMDLNDPQLEQAIRTYLDPDHPSFNKVKYCGLAFVGFNSAHYPPENERAVTEKIAAAMKQAVVGWRHHMAGQITALNVEQFDIHFVCLPFPSVQAFRDHFLQKLGVTHASA
jgi:hypothetical protein